MKAVDSLALRGRLYLLYASCLRVLVEKQGHNARSPVFVHYSQADGGPEVGNLQDKQYHRSFYADEVHYGQGKNATVKTWGMNLSGKIQDGRH